MKDNSHLKMLSAIQNKYPTKTINGSQVSWVCSTTALSKEPGNQVLFFLGQRPEGFVAFFRLQRCIHCLGWNHGGRASAVSKLCEGFEERAFGPSACNQRDRAGGPLLTSNLKLVSCNAAPIASIVRVTQMNYSTTNKTPARLS